jgi:hypothetical protein
MTKFSRKTLKMSPNISKKSLNLNLCPVLSLSFELLFPQIVPKFEFMSPYCPYVLNFYVPKFECSCLQMSPGGKSL